jgi:hypothetical protein
MSTVADLRDKYECGVTLLEIILVMALGTVLVFFTVPVSMRYVRAYTYETSVQTLMTCMRATQHQSRYDTVAHGIKLSDESLTTFEGSSYDERVPSKDVDCPLHVAFTRTGVADEVVFHAGTGIPANPVTFDVSVYDQPIMINVSSLGLVTRE